MDVMRRDGNVHHPNNWKGYNVMGDLLTHLRTNLMDDPAYGEEVKAAREHMAGRVAKRPRESPDAALATKRPVLTGSDSAASEY